MSWIFLDTTCQESSRNEVEFGICDNEDGTKAYTDISNSENWIAKVLNPNEIDVSFIAVDKCIFQDSDEPGRGRCDGILLTDDQLYFVELKNQKKSWINDAISQLESTIDFFKESHDIQEFKHKKAFACNKKFKYFQEIDNELNLEFFRKHKFRIDIQSDIIII